MNDFIKENFNLIKGIPNYSHLVGLLLGQPDSTESIILPILYSHLLIQRLSLQYQGPHVALHLFILSSLHRYSDSALAELGIIIMEKLKITSLYLCKTSLNLALVSLVILFNFSVVLSSVLNNFRASMIDNKSG